MENEVAMFPEKLEMSHKKELLLPIFVCKTLLCFFWEQILLNLFPQIRDKMYFSKKNILFVINFHQFLLIILHQNLFRAKSFLKSNVQQSANEFYKISIENSKCAIQNGRPDRYWKLKRMMEKRKETPHTPTQPEREHPAVEVSPNSPCGAISLGRCPSYQRNPKMAQKMKKLRSLHILHVPPSKSKTN